MTDDEKYLFDLNGYLVIDDLLTPEEIRLGNEGVDRHWHEMKLHPESLANASSGLTGERPRSELHGLPGWEDPYGPLFRRMLAHPRLVPYLHELLGQGFRLDHNMFMLGMERGTEGFYFHGGAGPDFDFNMLYLSRNGKLYSTLTVVSIQLTDVNPGDGGFAVVPGSHKANFTAPRAMLHYEAYREHVRPVTCRAGSALIFTEALTHGTLPWRSDRPRRTLLSRYTRSNMAYVPAKSPPEWAGERERILMEPPYHPRLNRPVLQEEKA